jgi:hypothetical protein
VTLDLGGLPTHDSVEISYDLYIIDSWDGNSTQNDYGPDYWTWWAGGERQLRTTFVNANPPYNWQFYPGEPFTPSGIRLIDGWLSCGGPSILLRGDTVFTEIDWDVDCIEIGDDTAAVLYTEPAYGGNYQGIDGKWCHEQDSCPSGRYWPNASARVWAAANDWRDHADEIGTLGYDPDSVYHITKTIDHTSDTLQLAFEGSNLQGLSDESWGLDNVRVRATNRDVPLRNSSFTISVWAQRWQLG